MTHPSLLHHWVELKRQRQRGFILNPLTLGGSLTVPTYDTLLFALTGEVNGGGNIVDESPYEWVCAAGGTFRDNSGSPPAKFGAYGINTVVGNSIQYLQTKFPGAYWDLQRSTATVGFWMYPKSPLSAGTIICQRDSSTGTGWALSFDSAGVLSFTYNNSSFSTAAILTANTWFHILLSISGGTAYLFINGTLQVSGSVSFGVGTAIDQGLRIAGSSTQITYSGYLDDLFITDQLLTTVDYRVPTSALVPAYPGSTSAWSTTDKGSGVIVSQPGARCAYLNSTVFGIQSLRGATGRSVGTDYYFEVSCSGGSGGGVFVTDHVNLVGVGNSSASLSAYPGGDANGWAFYLGNGDKYTNNTNSSYATATTYDVVGVWLTAAGGLRFKTSSTDPVTNAFTGLTGTLYPMWGPGSGAGNRMGSLNTGGTSFKWGLPSGATAWG